MEGAKIYISGKITNNPVYKLQFAAAERELKNGGFQPVNPAREILPAGSTWADYMRHDIRLLCDCSAIYMLTNWRQSKGARLERRLAQKLGLKIIYESDFEGRWAPFGARQRRGT